MSPLSPHRFSSWVKLALVPVGAGSSGRYRRHRAGRTRRPLYPQFVQQLPLVSLLKKCALASARTHGELPYGQRERVGRCTPRLRIKQLLASCSVGRVMISLHPDSCNGFTHQYSHLLHPHLRACLFGAGLPPLRQVPPPTKAAPLEQPQGSPPPPLRLPPSAAAATGTASSGTGRTSQLWGSDGELWTAGGRLNDFSYAG